MKIECPHCRLTGQVSDASVPAEGRHMECPRCKKAFFVEKSVTASWADTLTDCPHCGYSNFSGERFDICPTCGLVALVWGIIGFCGYWKLTPAQAVVSEFEEPPGPVALYLTRGLLPTLQVLLGLYAAAAGSQFLQLRPWARKGVEVAAWGGIAFAVGCEVADLTAWIRRSSGSASFSYYLVGVADTLLMAAIWSAPLVVTILYLRGDTIGEAFEE